MSDSWRFISTIAKKEVIEFVRDWRTLIALIVIPLLIFPALFIALPLLLQSEAAELDAMEFMTLVKEKMKLVQMNEDLLSRSVNQGFSGGEKKRNEVFQMTILEPKLAILDETDSGLDIDALKIVANGVNSLRNNERAFIVVTHYQRLLDYIKPDYVHVLGNGKIIKSGGPELAIELEEKGYDWIN